MAMITFRSFITAQIKARRDGRLLIESRVNLRKRVCRRAYPQMKQKSGQKRRNEINFGNARHNEPRFVN
jgi:hypothetical protein